MNNNSSVNIMDISIEQPIIYKTEKVNKKKAQWVINNFDKIVLRSKIDDEEKKTIKNNVIDYCTKIVKSKDGSVKVMYTKSKNQTTGRYYCNNGLQSKIREVRHTLCKNDYVDVDMVNSEAVILLNYCKQNKIDCDNLEYYTEHRDDIITAIIDQNKPIDLRRSDIKMMFLKMINGGAVDNILSDDEFTSEFHNELKNMRSEIVRLNPSIAEFIKKIDKNKSNINASVVSHLYQIIENKILMMAHDYLTTLKFDVDVFIFDGFLVRNHPNFNENVLEQLNEYIYEKTNYDVEFVIKDMNEGYDISDDELKAIKDNVINQSDDYIDIKKEYEKNHFLSLSPYGFCHYDEDDDKLKIYNKSEMDTILKNKKVKKDDKEVSFFKNWLEDQNRRECKSIIFEPTMKEDNRYFNLFTGFEFDNTEYDKNVDCEPIFKVLKHVLKTDDVYDYVMDWFAYIIQKRQKTEKCIFLISDKHGVGKSSIINLFRAVINKKYSSEINSIEDLEKDFNGLLENKLLVTGNEIEAKQKDSYKTFKNAVTRTTIIINKKNVEPYELNDYTNYFFTTNNYIPIKIEAEDRRCVIIECNNKLLNEESYTEFYACLKNKDCLISMFHFFKNRKVPVRLGMLDTNIKKDIQSQFRSSIFKYLYEKMDILDGVFLSTKKLLDNLKEYEKANNYREMTTPQIIANNLLKISENLKPIKSTKQINGERPRGYDFTNLKKYLEEYDKEMYDNYCNSDINIVDDDE